MKRETAIRMAKTVRDRLIQANGLIGTPGCCKEAIRVKRAWVFGSTVKGSQSPNDLDLLLDVSYCGRRFRVGSGSKVDRRTKQNCGAVVAADSKIEAYKYIRGGLKKLSIHSLDYEDEYANPRVMIYPRNDLGV